MSCNRSLAQAWLYREMTRRLEQGRPEDADEAKPDNMPEMPWDAV